MALGFATPRAAYVHVPFCRHRCGYCNFSVVANRADLFDKYLRAIERELVGLETPRVVDTLYVGGGTPTELAPARLRRLGELLARWFPVSSDYEFTVEANPNDLSDETVDVLAAMGVNRISLGAQSFDPDKLSVLERTHTAVDVQRAVSIARDRIDNVSLDLIFGVPGETMDRWRLDLTRALALWPAHISTYGLTYERGAAFWSRLAKGKLSRVNEELERELYLMAMETLTGAGLEHYEISSFARPGQRSRHNLVYWSGQGYYAVGPGATRYVGGQRATNHRSTTTYLRRVLSAQSPVAEAERLSAEDRARERLVFGLRTLEGVDKDQFVRETGFEIAQLLGQPLENFLSLGLLRWAGRRLQLTREGLLVSDSMWPDFLRV